MLAIIRDDTWNVHNMEHITRQKGDYLDTLVVGLKRCLNKHNSRIHSSLQLRHNERNGVSNHLPYDCLLNGLFRCRWKKAPKLRVNGLWAANSPVTSKFPAQKASGEFLAPRATNAENISIWWRHHVSTYYVQGSLFTGFVAVWLISSIAFRSLTYFLHWQYKQTFFPSRGRHQMEGFPALLVLCTGNPPVTDGFPSQRPVMGSFNFLSLICAWANA